MEKIDTRMLADHVKAIRQQATKEQRSFCNMIRILLIEALKERGLI
jgi:hypothetical protein